MTATIVGALVLGVPLVLGAAAFLWRRNRPVFWFAVALIVVSLGYLMASGAANDIGNRVIPQIPGLPAAWPIA